MLFCVVLFICFQGSDFLSVLESLCRAQIRRDIEDNIKIIFFVSK